MAPAMRWLPGASYSDRSSIVGPRPTFSMTARTHRRKGLGVHHPNRISIRRYRDYKEVRRAPEFAEPVQDKRAIYQRRCRHRAAIGHVNLHLEGLRSSGDGLSYVPKTKQSNGLFCELAMYALGRAGRVDPIAPS